MASPSYTYTLANSTTADASQVMQDFNDILNGVTDGTKDLSISALTCAGTATLNGHVNLGNSSSDDLSITASLASSLAIKTNNTYDIGSATLGLRKLYLGNAGAGATCDIVAASHATTREYTIPDCDAAASFVMTAGNQTIGGDKTFSSRMVVSAAACQFSGSDNSSSGVIDIRNSNSTMNSSTIGLTVGLIGNSVATNAQFIAFYDADGVASRIGSVSAASGTTVAYNTSSDARRKTNITDFTGALEILANIKPRRFDWIKTGDSDVGFIAQELKAAYPYPVTGLEDDPGYNMGIDYGKLTPVLTAALKELVAKVEMLEARLDAAGIAA